MCEEYYWKQFFPKNDIAASFLLVVSTYTTLLAIVDQASTKEALKDADNQTKFNINEDIVNVTISQISKSILWNCREYSVTKGYYRGFYIALITILLAYVIIGMSKVPRRCFCDEDCEKTCAQVLQFLSDCSLRVSLIFLLTSYDVDPWACLLGPSSIDYIEDTQAVELKFPVSVLRYQTGAPFISGFFGVLGWILGMCVQEDEKKDTCNCNCNCNDCNCSVKDKDKAAKELNWIATSTFS